MGEEEEVKEVEEIRIKKVGTLILFLKGLENGRVNGVKRKGKNVLCPRRVVGLFRSALPRRLIASHMPRGAALSIPVISSAFKWLIGHVFIMARFAYLGRRNA